MYSVILTELGIAVFDGKQCLKAFAFSNPSLDYLRIKNGQADVGELVKFLSELRTGVTTNNNSLLSFLKKKSIDVQLMNESEIDQIQTSKPKLLVEAGFAKDLDDALKKLREFAIQISSSKISEVSESPDLHIIQSINALDELDRIINGLSSRLREWYGLHFPELDNLVDSIQGYAHVVLGGKRIDLNKKVFEEAGFPESKVEMLALASERSKGGDISNENLAIVQSLAKQILELHEVRKKLEENIETQINTVAPNLAAILGAAVGARILARAGSLKKVATMPASTIQVLGAEKALFRSLKTGSQPPKHGLLFQHAMVHSAPRWQRGKIARAVAAKAAIAARVDVYGGGFNKTLLEKLNVRVNEIGKKYQNPQPPKPRQDVIFRKGQKKSKMRKKRKKFGRR